MMKNFLLFHVLLLSIPCLAQTFEGCFANSESKPSDYYILYQTSGNSQLDAFLIREVAVLRTFYGVQPSFFIYYENSGESPNAFATPTAQLANYPSGTVCFGVGMISKETSLGRGTTTIPIIAAHEFGHILDFQKGVTTHRGIGSELFADFQAGCYLFYRHFFLQNTDIQQTLIAFFEMGDYADFNNPNHHGTPQQRLNTILAGFNWLQSVSKPGVNVTSDMAIAAAKSYLGLY